MCWVVLGWVEREVGYSYFFTEFSVCYNIMCKENLQITRVHVIVVLQKKVGLVLGSNLVYSGWEFSLQPDNQSITTRNAEEEASCRSIC